MSRLIGRAALLEFLARPGAILSCSYGLNTTVHAYSPNGGEGGRTVRFDTFQRLLKDGAIIEMPRYSVQPASVFRYQLAASKGGPK